MISNLIKSINRCLIPKLSKDYYENAEYLEFDDRNKNLVTNFQIVIECLRDLKTSDLQKNTNAVVSLLNLYYELKCDGQWNGSPNRISELLDSHFQAIASISIEKIFLKNDVFDTQKIFNTFLDEMHSKLTFEDFKKYPAQIEVYYIISQNVKDYDVTLEPSKVFPLSLVLIEDYENFNKKKGLQCCTSFLQALESSSFQNGNYYDVIYRSIKRNLSEKENDIRILTCSNLLMLLDLLPDSGKGEILDELYKTCLDILFVETNLYQKAAMFNFTSKLIQFHKNNCANKSIFKDIVYQNLDICINNAVMEIVLEPLLECLERWIIYCWPMWKCGSDKILSALFKVLYVSDKEHFASKIHNIIITLIYLATKDEQSKIISHLNRIQEHIHCNAFQKKIKDIIFDLH